MELLTSFFNENPQVWQIGLIAMAIILIAVIIQNLILGSKIKKLMRGQNGNSLEASFLSMQKDISGFYKFKDELEKYLAKIEKRVKRSIQGMESVNFSAFKGMDSGGKSFATALLNENGDGIILSSLQARDRVSIFSKKVSKFQPEMELTEEESQALTKARQSCSL